MNWAPGLQNMLDRALANNVPAMVRAEARHSFIEEAERHATEREADAVGEEDLMYVAYQVTPPDRIEVMERTYRELGINVDAYKPKAGA
jgi:hypothetical protein